MVEWCWKLQSVVEFCQGNSKRRARRGAHVKGGGPKRGQRSREGGDGQLTATAAERMREKKRWGAFPWWSSG